ncbi:MAG: hypothetical protein ACRD2Z_04585 [Thermoanaerobaculia bacterium]
MKRLSLAVFGLLLLLGCRSETFEQRVERLRRGYTISSSGFVVKRAPEPAAAPEGAGAEVTVTAEGAAAEEAAGPEAAEGAVEQEDGIVVEDLPLAPVLQDVTLDLLVRNDNVADRLPGLTLDIALVDAAGNEKDRRRVWIDTSEIARGPGVQLSHDLEDVELAEGDTFHVEMRSPVPAEERAEYREFTPE